MSDPVTNVEIEDVLSSIRRLVSSEGRGPVAAPREAPKEPDKLVLTPALRVDDARPAAVAPSPEPAPREARDTDETHGDRPGDEVAQAESVPDVRSHAEEIPDEARQDAAQVEYGPQDGLAPQTADASQGDLPDRSAELTARVAELEHIVARSSDQWEPDGQSSDDYSGGPVDPLPWEDYLPGAESETPPDDEDPAGDAGDGAIAEDESARGAGSDHDEAGDDDPEWDAEDRGGHESPYDDADWDADDIRVEPKTEAPAAAAASARERDEAGHDAALGGEDMLADGDEILDEDALRDLVAEIVRQELQGALGERITRNVRKLVRREIHRALTCQELE